MRAGRTYRCPVCGEQSSHSVPCIRCGVGVRDENGHPPPPLFERTILYRGLGVGAQEGQAGGVTDLIVAAAWAARSVGRRITESRRQSRRRKAMKRVRRTTIAQAVGPLVHVAGRVEMLAPADPAHPHTAFMLERVREHGGKGSRTIETRVICSKFLVHDESGAALVDDDFVTVLPRPGTTLPANANAMVMAKDGQQVEVCGPAEQRVVPELGRIASQHGYRREPRVLCFDGRPDSLLLLRPLEG